MKILVIEDDQGIRQVICEILKVHSYECTPLMEGKAALEYLEKNSNSDFLVFVDLVMPGMNGWEFLRHVRKLRNKIRMKIIVVTGIQSARIALRNCDFDGILEKPFKIESILKCIYDFEQELKSAA